MDTHFIRHLLRPISSHHRQLSSSPNKKPLHNRQLQSDLPLSSPQSPMPRADLQIDLPRPAPTLPPPSTSSTNLS
jgi:hypothetical protein